MPALAPLRPVSQLHADLVARLEVLPQVRGVRDVWIAPRGSAKSTWSTLAFPLWASCEGYERYTVLTADTSDQAEDYLSDIKAQVNGNYELQRWYPDVRPGLTWRTDKAALTNGVVIRALGTGGRIRGRRQDARRPTCIIVDDPQNLQHVVSPLQRERSLTWMFKDVLNAGSPMTNVIVLGTALHRECIVCTLQGAAGWNARLYRSIIEWPARMDLWQQWENILHCHDDPDRAERARLFYLANEESMNA